MKKKTKVILSVVFTLWFIILIGASNSSSDTPTNTGNDTPQTEQEEMSTTEETNAEEAETVPHREGMYGVSDRDIESLDIDNQFTVYWKLENICHKQEHEF